MSPKKPKISAVIITKNEEENIKCCLENIKDIVDEIVVVDSYSSDKTVKIAKKYTNKVYFKRFEDDFSKQRNFGLQKATGDWILSIDADERLSSELKKTIPRLLITDKYQGYLFSRRNYIDTERWLKYGIFYPDWQLKLFKRGRKFKGRIHERPDLDEKFCKKINLDIIHNASHTKYNRFSSIFRLRKFIKIQAKEIAKEKRFFLVYPFIGLFKSVKYFLDSFIFGKGFLDGWVGFRGAIIFASQSLISFVTALKIKVEGCNSLIINNFLKTFYENWNVDAALRYLPIVRIINIDDGKDATILEVGTGSLGITPYLKREITGVDLEFKGPTTKLLKKICFTADNLPFSSRFFDYVISVDLLEHIPPARRKRVIKELLRVAKKKIFLAFPCGRPAEAEDVYLSALFQRVMGRKNKFLEQHLKYGLPKLESVLKIITDDLSEANIQILNNVNVYLHKILMTIKISKNKTLNFISGVLFLQLIPVFRHINWAPTYRKILVIKKMRKTHNKNLLQSVTAFQS